MTVNGVLILLYAMMAVPVGAMTFLSIIANRRDFLQVPRPSRIAVASVVCALFWPLVLFVVFLLGRIDQRRRKRGSDWYG